MDSPAAPGSGVRPPAVPSPLLEGTTTLSVVGTGGGRLPMPGGPAALVWARRTARMSRRVAAKGGRAARTGPKRKRRDLWRRERYLARANIGQVLCITV